MIKPKHWKRNHNIISNKISKIIILAFNRNRSKPDVDNHHNLIKQKLLNWEILTLLIDTRKQWHILTLSRKSWIKWRLKYWTTLYNIVYISTTLYIFSSVPYTVFGKYIVIIWNKSLTYHDRIETILSQYVWIPHTIYYKNLTRCGKYYIFL